MIAITSIKQFIEFNRATVSIQWLGDILKLSPILVQHGADYLGLRRTNSVYWVKDKTKFMAALEMHNPDLYFQLVEQSVKDL